ncbi:hypothetical protein EV368DRAFT_85924 [Lentinula lateritia]|nr:hypothetical protein EV368DRAFT_85924 [Lentinula lateritia]
MAEQKALQLEKAKGSFVISTVPILKPGPGQLSVKVITAALNPADWKLQTLGVFIQKYPAKKIANAPIKIAFNAVGDKDSRTACIDAIVEGGQVADVNPQSKDVDPGNGKRIFPIFGGSHHPPHKDFNRILWKTLPKLVQEEKIVPNRVEKLPNGLAGIDEGLQRLKAGKVSGVKLVAFPQETA